MQLTSFALIFMLCVSFKAFAIKCEFGFITKGANQKETLTQCGPPLSKQKLAKNFKLDYWPTGKKSLWIYHLNSSQFLQYLYFVDNKLELIENGPRVKKHK